MANLYVFAGVIPTAVISLAIEFDFCLVKHFLRKQLNLRIYLHGCVQTCKLAQAPQVDWVESWAVLEITVS